MQVSFRCFCRKLQYAGSIFYSGASIYGHLRQVEGRICYRTPSLQIRPLAAVKNPQPRDPGHQAARM